MLGGMVDCPLCQGFKKIGCPACGGSGVLQELAEGGPSQRPCPACQGNGVCECTACQGSGLKQVVPF
jgi:DnaJ-class molecular chaperone